MKRTNPTLAHLTLLARRGFTIGSVILVLLVPSFHLSVTAEDPKPKTTERLRPAGIDGSLVICGGGSLPDAVMKRYLQLAGGEKAHLVIIPTASESADKETEEKLLTSWKERKPASVVLLHTRSRQTANEDKFVEPLKKATGVWFEGGSQSKIAEAYLGTAVEKELHALLQRGGVIGGTSAGAAVMSRLMIASGNPEAKMATGFDFLPGTIIDQHFLKRERKPRLMAVLEKNPGRVGIGIDEGTALIVQGRDMRVLGDSTVSICLARSTLHEARTIELKSGAQADLTAWRRAAFARAEPPFPPKESPIPDVPSGSLVIVGGGGMPNDITKKFLELAGGPDALIVILPTANPGPISPNAGGGFFQQAGAKNVKVLPARELKDVEDPKNLDILKQAKGVWFGGGRQWRFVDAYEHTKAHDAFRDVLKRGGVIGGSSAGATIQGDYLCRGSPLNNTEMACEGYERGLGFLPGVAIDQHFSQRKRFGDMTGLMKTYPQLLGIGIDEATAIVVKGQTAEAMGRGNVHFYDRRKPVEEGKPDYESIKTGQKYDLKARKIVEPEKKD